jgi:3,4-dihydroxy 2-butanone 4-phosphate synthase/GTP cyclohydrolase II
MAAEHATPEALNFFAKHGRGLVCVGMLRQRLGELQIPPMVAHPTDPRGTAFHVGVDACDGTTTGISASDRAKTIRALASRATVSTDFIAPGHVFPLAYRDGGVLRRAGHTEASVDLCLLGGLEPAAIICEIAADDGEMARLPSLVEFAALHKLVLTTINDLVAYRRQRETLVRRVVETTLPINGHDWRTFGYRELLDEREHLAMVLGDVRDGRGLLVRVHSECLTGDVFGSRRCDCGPQLDLAMRMIEREGRGVVVYMRGHEGRGIGLLEKLHAYTLQDGGLDTVDANLALGHPVDRRDYGIGMQILADLGVSEMRLLTNNPAKRAGLEGYGLVVRERIPLLTKPIAENVRYLNTKEHRLGHALHVGENT